jgi:hypothetical protein
MPVHIKSSQEIWRGRLGPLHCAISTRRSNYPDRGYHMVITLLRNICSRCLHTELTAKQYYVLELSSTVYSRCLQPERKSSIIYSSWSTRGTSLSPSSSPPSRPSSLSHSEPSTAPRAAKKSSVVKRIVALPSAPPTPSVVLAFPAVLLLPVPFSALRRLRRACGGGGGGDQCTLQKQR